MRSDFNAMLKNLSSTIGSETSSIGSASNDRQSAVDRKQPEGLADFVRRVRFEKGFSLLDVQRNSHNQIAGSYVSRIENGIADADGVTPKKLQALALGLQIPEDEIFAVARGKSLSKSEVFESEIYLMLKGYDELTDKDKGELLPTVQMLAAEIRRRKQKSPKPSKKAPVPERLPIIDTRVTPAGGHPSAEVVSLARRGRKK